MNYQKAPHHASYWSELAGFYAREWSHLGDLCRSMLRLFLQQLGITTPIVLSSDIPTTSGGTSRLAELCRAVGGDTYLSGEHAGRAYLEPSVLASAGIRLAFQEWRSPVYAQLYPQVGFVPDLSIVDLLFNEGPRARALLLDAGRVTFA